MLIRKVAILLAVIALISGVAYADNFKDLSSKDAAKRIAAGYYYEEKAETEGLTEEELSKLVELADDPNGEVRVAARDSILKNINLELTDEWAVRYKNRDNKYGAFVCYANLYFVNKGIIAASTDAEIKDIIENDMAKAKASAIEAYKSISDRTTLDLTKEIYNRLNK